MKVIVVYCVLNVIYSGNQIVIMNKGFSMYDFNQTWMVKRILQFFKCKFADFAERIFLMYLTYPVELSQSHIFISGLWFDIVWIKYSRRREACYCVGQFHVY